MPRSASEWVSVACARAPCALSASDREPPTVSLRPWAAGCAWLCAYVQRWFVIFGDELFFNAPDGTTDALWKTDGTADGTIKVFELTLTHNPNPEAHPHPHAHP